MSRATIQKNAPGTTTPGQSVTLTNVIRSEWIKFHTLKSMIILLLIAGLLEVAFAAIISWFMSGPTTYAVPLGNSSLLAQVAIAVMASLAITGEYSSMSMRSTLTAVPARMPVLYAKLIVVAVTTFVVMAAFTLVAFGAVWLVAHAKISETPVAALDSFFAIVILLTGTSVICFFIGVIVRSTAGTLGISIGLIFVPMILDIVASISTSAGAAITDFIRFLPFSGLNNIANYGFETHFRPWYYVSAIGWVVVLGIIATWLFKKRDA